MNTPQIDRNMFAQIRNFCLTAEQSAKEAGVLLALGKEDEAKAFIDRGILDVIRDHNPQEGIRC